VQTLRFPPVTALLDTFWNAGSNAAPGRAQRARQRHPGSPIATGDVVIICLILVLCCGARASSAGASGWCVALVLGTGVFAAGQFSTWIAALVGFALIAWRSPSCAASQALRAAGVVALVIGAPAFLGRLEGIGEFARRSRRAGSAGTTTCGSCTYRISIG